MNYSLSASEWEVLCPLLNAKQFNDTQKNAAEVCLYRYTNRLASNYCSFGWHNIPKSFTVSGATANRLFREWCNTGQWFLFWDKLLELRFGKQLPAKPNKLLLTLEPTHAIQLELQRAYNFFNRRFLGGHLPETVCITIDTFKKNYFGYTYFSTVWINEKDFWYHIAITDKAIQRGMNQTLGTLLHEMAHVFNASLGYRDTNENQYHTQDFRDVARLLGLQTFQRDKQRGYAKTILSERAIEAINQLNPVEKVYESRFIDI